MTYRKREAPSVYGWRLFFTVGFETSFSSHAACELNEVSKALMDHMPNTHKGGQPVSDSAQFVQDIITLHQDVHQQLREAIAGLDGAALN